MKKVVLFGSMLAFAVAMTGCKTEIEKYADAVCDCKDKKCVDELDKQMQEKHKGEKAEDVLKNLNEKDIAAIARGKECEDKLK